MLHRWRLVVRVACFSRRMGERFGDGLSCIYALIRIERGEPRVEDAATSLGLKGRQVFRLLDPTEVSWPLVGKRIDVCEYADGGLEIRYSDGCR